MSLRFCRPFSMAVCLIMAQLASKGLSAPERRQTAAFPPENSKKVKDAPAYFPVKRIILLLPSVPEENDSAVQRAVAAWRVEQAKPHRSSLFSGLGFGSGTAKSFPGAASERKIVDPNEQVRGVRLEAIAQLIFSDAMASRLHKKFRAVVLPSSEVTAARERLKLSFSEASGKEGAQQLCSALDGDVVLAVAPGHIRMREGATRDFGYWTSLRVLALRSTEHVFLPAAKSGAPASPHHIPAGTDFPISGTASARHAFLQSAFAQAPPALAAQAAMEAAAIAVHSLATGEKAPLQRDSDRIAIAPVGAPPTGDILLFTPLGRKSALGALRNLPTDVSAYFRPDLSPLAPESVLMPDEVRRAVPNRVSLWQSKEAPGISRAQELGRRLRVQYVLLAHITSIEVDADAPNETASTTPAEKNGAPTKPVGVEARREARVEAVGALIRVSDGALLWQDRSPATMLSRVPAQGQKGIEAANRQVVQDATRFALIGLQHQFRTYRSLFSGG